ncbi:MAG: DUF4325 domain-containing protein [Candidatus Woesearchaeota archaeon]
MKSIKMKKYFKSDSLSYRDSAKNFICVIKVKYPNEKVKIDFSDIQSISHSFADEILKNKMDNIQFSNLNPNIKKMFEIIGKRYSK